MLTSTIGRWTDIHDTLDCNDIFVLLESSLHAKWLPPHRLDGIFIFRQGHIEGKAETTLVGFAWGDTEAGDILEIDLSLGEIQNLTRNITFTAKPYPEFMAALISAGGLIEYTRRRLASRRI